MQTETTKKLFTVAEYYKMYETGAIGPDERTEFIDDEILKMSPIGRRHGSAVIRATDFLVRLFAGKAQVSVQVPIDLDEFNEPQPDVCFLKFREDYYESQRAGPADVLLVLVISDTSLRYDVGLRLRKYAEARIPEYWIENLQEQTLLVFRTPSKETYKTSLTFRRGDSVSLLAFPEVAFRVDDLLGPGVANSSL